MQPRQQTGFTSLYGIRVAVAVAAVALVSSWVLFNGIANASFYGDESGWISSGMYYSHLLSNRDFTRAKWDCNDCKTWGALNAPLGKLLIGAAYWGCDTPNPCTFNAYYDFFQSFEENQRLGNVPPEYILRRGRYSAATAGVICCLLAFAVGYMLGQPKLLLAFLCAGLVLSTQIFRLSANRAMTDAFYNLFLLAQLTAAIAIVRSGNELNIVARLSFAGVLVGLTASVKPSGFVLGFPLFLLVAVYRLSVGGGYKRPESGRAFFSAALAFVAASIAVIYLLNPTFWPSGLSDSWRLVGFPEVLLAWNRYMTRQDVELGLGQWTGNHIVDIHRSIFVTYSNLAVNILFCLGLTLCTRRCVAAMRRGIADVSFVPVAYFLCNYGLLVCFLRLNWDRYYVPIELSMRVLAAIGMAGLAVAGYQWAASLAERREPESMETFR